MEENKIHFLDNLDGMRMLPDSSVDSIVTDGPYGFKFMGKKWDYNVPGVEVWKEALRILRPGGYLLSFGGTRTYHRMAVNIEDAGFEIRDQIQWIYGSGFPKSKSCLKPANEPICVARKPGPMLALNIDECRIEMAEGDTKGDYGPRVNCVVPKMAHGKYGFFKNNPDGRNDIGRYPTNVILDEYTSLIIDEQSGTRASRFFYCAKPTSAERNRAVYLKNNITVKPIKLIRYLQRLVTPPGGLTLDLYGGSGTSAIAAHLEGFRWILFENDKGNFEEAEQRIKFETQQKKLA